MIKELFLAVVVCFIFVGCTAEPESLLSESETETGMTSPEQIPSIIVAERGGFIPEGVEYDVTNDRILTGSLTEGSIFHLHNNGKLTAVVTDSELVSSVGIEVDEERDRLLVANSDLSAFQGNVPGQAKLGVYQLATGERIAMVDLAEAVSDAEAVYFANDVTVGDDGTAYVTDTRMNLIYQISSDYQASVLHRFDDPEGAGPNGIVYHSNGYLLVARGSALWKVPLDEPSGSMEVTLSEEVEGQDGMVWTVEGSLAIVSNSENRVVALRSDDEWMTASLVGIATYEIQGTTAAVVGNDVYVVHPQLADEVPPSVERVVFN